MDERTRLLIQKLPLPSELSIADAVVVLGGSHWAATLMREVEEGHFSSWSHSPRTGPLVEVRNYSLGRAGSLPRITRKTSTRAVFVDGHEVLWRWCVEYEGLIQGVDLPSKESVLARERLVLDLARKQGGTLVEQSAPDEDPLSLMYSVQEREKREQGRYTLDEAAEEISRETGERRETVSQRLKEAARQGTLCVYAPGEKVKLRYTAAKPVRTFHEEAYWDDLNAWLAENEPRLGYRFSLPGRDGSTVPIDIDADGTTQPLKAVTRALVHRTAISKKLKELGYDLLALPKTPPGKASVAKQAARKALYPMSQAVFDKAWQALLKDGEISEGKA